MSLEVNPSRPATPSTGDLHLSGSDVVVKERKSAGIAETSVSAAICDLASAPLLWVPCSSSAVKASV